jgi:segregation and condensation protein B
LYGTSELFLERFGLRSLEDLPPLEEFAPDEESKQQIQDGLMGSLSRIAGLDMGDQGAGGDSEGADGVEREAEAAGEGEDRQAGTEPEPEDIETVD